MAKIYFFSHYCSPVSNDPSEIILICWVAFVEFKIFLGFFDEQKVQNVFEVEIFCNIINILTFKILHPY